MGEEERIREYRKIMKRRMKILRINGECVGVCKKKTIFE